MSLALWLLVYLLVTYAIGKLWELVVGWKTTALLFYPGMLAAAGGRMLASAIGQNKQGKVDVMRSGGPTEAEAPQGGTVLRFLHSVLPFALCLGIFIGVWAALGEPIDTGYTLPRLEANAEVVGDSAQAAGKGLNAVLNEVADKELGDWKFWVFLYAGFALIVAPAPGRHDLVGIAALCGAVGGATMLLSAVGVEVVAKGVYKGAFWEGFSLLFGMALLVLVLSCVLLLPMKLLGKKEK